jgi:hypothetical protein
VNEKSDAMCEAIVLENMIVDRIEQAAAILGAASMVRHPDNLFDEDLIDEYGPRLPQAGDCLCYLDIEATAERAGYVANVAPHDPYHRWVLTKKPPPVERRVLQWLSRNAWVFVVILLSFMFYHFGVAMESPDRGSKGSPVPRWNFDVRFDRNGGGRASQLCLPHLAPPPRNCWMR